ncbi:MAG: polysaccharide deacetylase family protein [Clostridiales bacterium]|nr:polysaccharide deacetylase family protein [Clostridiales bacterium]
MFRQMFEEKYMRFPEGKCKALTFSYDDGVKADIKLLKVFEKYGLKGTFNLNSKLFDCENWHGRMDEEGTFNAFKGCGQEIAMHGARHIFMDKVPLCEAVKEAADNRAYLEEKFGCIVRGWAYAYGGYNGDIKRVLSDLGAAYARTTHSTYAFTVPTDWLELNPTCHHTEKELLPLADKFFGGSPLKEFKHRESWLFYVWGHSYEFDDDNNWDIIENLGKRAAENKGDIWLATNIEIYDYVRAYERLVFSFDGERVFNPSAQSVWIELRGKTYEIASGETVKFNA